MDRVEVDLKQEIARLKRERDAVILAHNYQLPEVQDVADFIGDSLALSQKAASTDAKVIVFCGVHFMAETASIICPDKRVLIPDLEAGCSLASTITVEQLRAWKKEHPDAVTVCYINTSADVKAECDYCCTSSNAVKVVKSIPEDKPVLFLPDMFLGAYVAEVTKRKNIYIWPGECHVHAGIRPSLVLEMLKTYRDAEFLIHPECGCTTSMVYYFGNGNGNGCVVNGNGNGNGISCNVKFLSTEGMMKYARQTSAKRLIVATEVGILYRMRKENPDKEFIPISSDAVCKYMKMITLDKVYRSLRDMVYEVKVPEETARRARRAIERMLAIN
ncbi:MULTISPECIES: quinolinate synthase NadA [Candidatus Nitrosocaldus]|jgi:quinolinate synthase|uniref:Quinolinate synthase n=1 Tax=Candidatus Nitrosocaldus cavascurensis TaxID=2058097 RepID=A0A2K5AR05_9ARCH|nr:MULTISPECIES: quinolinate synthase NadA [Candidatus Nitrosocaldus]SPC34034.1 Quinolinate synthase A [Candidatus Nitrosocaldus cavascurensis]